jgi:hypothetical protein
VVNTSYVNGKSVYDILAEVKTLREAYDFIYNNGYKSYITQNYKTPHFYNNIFNNVSVWKETDLEQLLIDYVNYIINRKDEYLGFKFNGYGKF